MNQDTAGSAHRGSRRGPWLVGAIAAIVLIVIAATTIFLMSREQEAEYPAGSPEAVFQAYARAWEEGDTDAAWAVLSTGAQARVPRYRLSGANRARPDVARQVWIDDVSGSEERVVLRLSVETIYEGGLFGSDRDRDETRVTLLREDGEWKIDTPLAGYFGW